MRSGFAAQGSMRLPASIDVGVVPVNGIDDMCKKCGPNNDCEDARNDGFCTLKCKRFVTEVYGDLFRAKGCESSYYQP